MRVDASIRLPRLAPQPCRRNGKWPGPESVGALQALIDCEATTVIGAAPHERTETHTTHRNGSRPKTLTTAAGDVTVAIPKTLHHPWASAVTDALTRLRDLTAGPIPAPG